MYSLQSLVRKSYRYMCLTVSQFYEGFVRLLHSRVQRSSFFDIVSMPGKCLQSLGNSKEIFSLNSRIDVICRFPFLGDSNNTV